MWEDWGIELSNNLKLFFQLIVIHFLKFIEAKSELSHLANWILTFELFVFPCVFYRETFE